jgi:hypothetical protein
MDSLDFVDSHVDSHFGEPRRFLAVQRGRNFRLLNSEVTQRPAVTALRGH